MIHDVIATRPSPLVRSLRRSAQAHGIDCVVLAEHERPWASATFVGARHRIALQADPSPAFVAWLASLPEADLPLRGALVADLTIEAPATIVALVLAA